MQTLEITAFGPIKQARLDIKDIIVFNGEQSSGKSTISKAIYFFRSLPETLFQSFMEDENITRDFEKKIVISCRNQLMSIFVTTKHFDDFKLKFDYAPKKYINIYKDRNSGHARVMFSSVLREGLKDIAVKLEQFREGETKDKTAQDFSIYRADRFRFLSTLKNNIKDLFQDSRRPIFIPAGRSLVSTLSGELKEIDSYRLDSLTSDFIQRIFYLRDMFSKDLEEIVEDKKRLSSTPIDFSRIKLARQLIENILRGRYRYENGEERILVDQDNYVKIKFASSGQQEALWILLLLFVEMLDNEPSFAVIEEPEAHLYPLTQYEILKLICLYAATPSNQAIITTHSPYIMAAINNLLMAEKTGQQHTQDVQKILPRLLWVDKNRLSAYFVSQGKIFDMFESETGIIDTHFIDAASEVMNQDFDQLLSLGE